MTTIDLVYVNAGGGHRSAALALEMAIREQRKDWQVRLVNLFEVLDPQDIFRRTTGVKPEDYYNVRLARGWTLGLAQELRILQMLIRLSHKSLVAQLRRHWQATRPDLIVSMVPNFNRAMYQASMLANSRVPYATILTDFADFPPHFWIEPNQAQHFICGTPRAANQARAAVRDDAYVHETSGMIINPDFYRDLKLDRREEMRKLRLDPDRPTGMVMFGGHGSRAMRGISKRLDDVQLILACGHNAVLAEQLRNLPASAPRLVLGFTSQIGYYMQLCDFFVGKPGPGSISEALQHGLPVIVVRNAWTMPQERYNTEWIEQKTVGVVLNSFKDIDAGVAQIAKHIELYRAGVRCIRNRAVFEIPEILERILAVPARVGVDLAQHFGTAERLHLS
jgi:UDP-N-acetylglucosamine:LPS N-acetylglucosamine transferase